VREFAMPVNDLIGIAGGHARTVSESN
jgi:hypothetical protein